jgi:hypothetical protein
MTKPDFATLIVRERERRILRAAIALRAGSSACFRRGAQLGTLLLESNQLTANHNFAQ